MTKKSLKSSKNLSKNFSLEDITKNDLKQGKENTANENLNKISHGKRSKEHTHIFNEISDDNNTLDEIWDIELDVKLPHDNVKKQNKKMKKSGIKSSKKKTKGMEKVLPLLKGEPPSLKEEHYHP